MNCPECDGETTVVDSRKLTRSIKRRRQCDNCGMRFTSYELPMTNAQYNQLMTAIEAIKRLGNFMGERVAERIHVKDRRTEDDEQAFIRREAIQEANQTGETVKQVMERWDREALELEKKDGPRNIVYPATISSRKRA